MLVRLSVALHCVPQRSTRNARGFNEDEARAGHGNVFMDANAYERCISRLDKSLEQVHDEAIMLKNIVCEQRTRDALHMRMLKAELDECDAYAGRSDASPTAKRQCAAPFTPPTATRQAADSEGSSSSAGAIAVGSGSPAEADTPLDVPFHERLMAKHHGAVWRDETKKWWAPRGVDLDPLARWMPASRIYLVCPYREKDAANTLGARWDPDAGKWYVLPGMNLEPFSRWLP